jgi:hypothetical protein
MSVTLTAAAPEFEATTLDGKSATGRLKKLDAQQAVLTTEQGETPFALDSLATLSRRGESEAPKAKPTLWVELVDESGIAAVEFLVKDNAATVTLTTGDKLELPTKAIRWVRFSAPLGVEDKLAAAFAKIAETTAAGDLVIVRKGDSLDFLEGVVGDLAADTCQFQFEGDSIPVKREKLEGVVYFHSAAADLPEAGGSVHTRDGSRLKIEKASLAGDRLQLALPGGAKWDVPLEEVTRIDFSAGKVAFLSDLDPERVEYEPYFGFREAAPALTEYYAFRRDVGFENHPLTLEGKSYRKGLALQSRTTLAYRLPGKFRVLKAMVGIDDAVRATGDAQLTIKADGKTLWEGELKGSEPARELELELAGARRLEIVADYGPSQDVGDRVTLGEARVTK